MGCESLAHLGLELGSGGTEGEDSLDVHETPHYDSAMPNITSASVRRPR